MKKTIYYFKKATPVIFFFVLISVMVFSSCKSGDEKEKTEKDNAIEIVTNAMDFNMVDEIPSGWNHFRYLNKSQETHFILLDKYPTGKTIDDGRNEVIPVFQKGMDLIAEGKGEEAQVEFGKLPAWFPDIVYTGGCGLLSPGKTCEFTLNLEPGYYVMECYVKMANGVFHGTMGMTKAFTVTDSVSGISAPNPDVHITISGTEGISYADSIKKGKNVFSVYYKDQNVHENFVGHDVNLVKLSANANLEELEKWMNWADPKGLIMPAPEGVTFLGGINDMPAGNTGYFSADLERGKYAFISEVPNTSSKGLLKTFEIVE